MKFFSQLNKEDIDNTICKLLDIPAEIYDKLPGESGHKFFTESEYDTLIKSGITRTILCKRINQKDNSDRKTMAFDENISKTISTKVSKSIHTNNPFFNLIMNSFDDDKVTVESYGFEKEDKNEFLLKGYDCVQADIDINKYMLNCFVKTITRNPEADICNTGNGVIKKLANFGNISNHHQIQCVANHSKQYPTSIIKDTRQYDSGMHLHLILENARQKGCTMFDEVNSILNSQKEPVVGELSYVEDVLPFEV